jgi:hypothetical protein
MTWSDNIEIITRFEHVHRVRSAHRAGLALVSALILLS